MCGCPQRPDVDVRPPGVGVTGSSRLPAVGSGNLTLKEQVLYTAEPSLQPILLTLAEAPGSVPGTR